MAETVNQENNANVQNPAPRVFTQAELDNIVTDRLNRERQKYADYETLKDKAAKFDAAEEANKTELQKATERAAALEKELNGLKTVNAARDMREKVSKDTGVPASLLTGDTEEACKAQAQSILAFAKPAAYPSVRDGGEVSGAPGKRTTAQAFEEYAAQALN